MKRLLILKFLACLACLLEASPAWAQLRVDDRVPADKKAVIAANIDVAKLYKNQLVKLLIDSATELGGNEFPIQIKDVSKISAFVGAPEGIAPSDLEQINFYVYVGFNENKPTESIRKSLIDTGGKEVEIGGKKLIGPPDGSPFYVDVHPTHLVIGTEDYLTMPTIQFATAGLAEAYSALPSTPVRVAVDFESARGVMDQLSKLANDNADFLDKPYVSLIDEVALMTMTSDWDGGSFIKVSLTGHDEAEAGKIKQKIDALLGLAKQMSETAPRGNPLTTLLEFNPELAAKQTGKSVVVEVLKPEGFEESLSGMIGSARTAAQKAAKRASDMNKFKQIAVAMHNYHAVHKEFPFAKHCEGEDSGKGLSWVVYLLPYLEQQALYEKFDLNADYDSPQNAKASRATPEVLQLASGGNIKWIRPSTVAKSMRNITDGTSNTAAFVQSKKIDMAPWTQAKSITPAEVIKQFKALKPGEGMIVGMYDGSVRRVTSEMDATDLEAMLEPADGKYPQR